MTARQLLLQHVVDLSEDDAHALLPIVQHLRAKRVAPGSPQAAPEAPEPGTATEQPAAAGGSAPKRAMGFKAFLRSMPNVGDDADFERPLDYGRPEIEWDT